METLSSMDLCAVTGGAMTSAQKIGPIPGTTIVHVPPKEAVCNREQFDWMADHIGKGVQWHVVAADAALCGYPTPKYSPADGPR
jgi:hypothetical protein